MEPHLILVAILIAIASVGFGVASGKAKADRLRQLRQDLIDRRPRGILVVVGVCVAIVYILTRDR